MPAGRDGRNQSSAAVRRLRSGGCRSCEPDLRFGRLAGRRPTGEAPGPKAISAAASRGAEPYGASRHDGRQLRVRDAWQQSAVNFASENPRPLDIDAGWRHRLAARLSGEFEAGSHGFHKSVCGPRAVSWVVRARAGRLGVGLRMLEISSRLFAGRTEISSAGCGATLGATAPTRTAEY